MESGSHAMLCRLLLQRSDRHPIASVNGDDLAGFSRVVIRQFEQLGILVERAFASDLGGIVFAPVGEHVAAISLDGEDEIVLVPARTVKNYDVKFLELCRQLRAANRFEGSKVEEISPKTAWLGALGSGSRRQEFYVARAVNVRNAVETALAIKARGAGGPVTILTPTERSLSGDILKRLSADRIEVVAIESILKHDAADPFTISVPLPLAPRAVVETARLIIDAQGHRATFDGVDVKLQRREFKVLVILANEHADQNGVVERDLISATIREVTGNEETNEEQITRAISRLRAALGKAAGMTSKDAQALIKSMRHVGYQLTLQPGTIRVT